MGTKWREGKSEEDFVLMLNKYIDELRDRVGEGNEDIIVNLVNELNYMAGGDEELVALEETYEETPKREMFSDKEVKEDLEDGLSFLSNIISTLLDDRAYLQKQNEALKKYLKGE